MGSMFKTFRPSERCFVSEGSLTQQRSLTLQHIFRKQAVIEVKKKHWPKKQKHAPQCHPSISGAKSGCVRVALAVSRRQTLGGVRDLPSLETVLRFAG